VSSTFTSSHRGGSGSPVVCLHGFIDTWRTWELVLPALEATTCSSSTKSATSRSNDKPPTCSPHWSPAATNAARSSSHSNRGFEQWGEILGDAMVAAALIDRLVHRATTITLKAAQPQQ
jgi:hypothetical protein